MDVLRNDPFRIPTAQWAPVLTEAASNPGANAPVTDETPGALRPASHPLSRQILRPHHPEQPQPLVRLRARAGCVHDQ
ncbi:hypothetical protein GCM10009540_63120 [Streptomyces turgidiscabies]